MSKKSPRLTDAQFAELLLWLDGNRAACKGFTFRELFASIDARDSTASPTFGFNVSEANLKRALKALNLRCADSRDYKVERAQDCTEEARIAQLERDVDALASCVGRLEAGLAALAERVNHLAARAVETKIPSIFSNPLDPLPDPI